MRIDSTARSQSAARLGSVSRAGGESFALVPDLGTVRAGSSQPLAPASTIDALLALQSVEDPLLKKKRALRRGNALLDTLENIKEDLLVGRVSEGRLNHLMALVGQARERQMPELDGVLDDIELRARVELAKFGRHPGP